MCARLDDRPVAGSEKGLIVIIKNLVKKPLQLLHLEDDPLDAEMLERILKAENLDCALTRVKTQPEFEAALEQGRFELIVSDYSLPTFDGLSALKLARKKCPEIPFIFVSGTIGEERAIESLKQGATDYVIKDRPSRLVPAIRRALAEAEDARQRQQAEEQVRAQAALLDCAQDAICLNDLNQRILYWNKSAERLYGWSAEEALGRIADDLLFQGDLTSPSAALKSLIRGGGWQGELHQVTKDQKKIIVESRWTLMRDQRGEPKSILIINTDITEKKQIQAQLLRTQRMESIGALAGGIAHDLNNALTPVLMAFSFIRDELVTEDSKRLLALAQTSARRSVDMVKQILSFARGVGGEHAPLQLRHLVDEMVKLAEDTFPRSIQIQSKAAPHLWPVRGNATQLHQVLLNLCLNARDAMPNGGCLRIEASNVILEETSLHGQSQVPGSYVLLTAGDTGSGMDPEILGKIFEPFFTTKEAGRGTGLGLSTVMGIVKTHGGFVEVTSEVGHGSVFRIFLPATSQPPETSSGEENPAESSMGHGEVILVIDDEFAVLEVTKLLLESFNYSVLTAKHGAEGVAIYERHRAEIKVVVTDMMMPVMNGPETIQALRRIDPALKIIGMSGLGSESVLTKAGQLGVQAFLKKPFAAEELRTVLCQLLATEMTVNAPVPTPMVDDQVFTPEGQMGGVGHGTLDIRAESLSL
ncbi:MAG: sensor hybrid histidine kinase [Pedosphaera sp.]|nr:sensor hybrid histidine kinase [Pedosphaera sp.]